MKPFAASNAARISGSGAGAIGVLSVLTRVSLSSGRHAALRGGGRDGGGYRRVAGAASSDPAGLGLGPRAETRPAKSRCTGQPSLETMALMLDAQEAPAGTPRRRRTAPPAWMVVALACAGQFLVVLDVSVVNVALPSMRTGLGLSEQGLQWVVNAYAIAFAGFMLLGG